MGLRRLAIGVIMGAVCVAASAGAADLAALLAASGHGPATHALVAVWDEAAPAQPGLLVRGARVRPLDGGPALDLYFAGDRALDRQDLRALGVGLKRWDAAPRQAPARPGGAKAAHAPAIDPGLAAGLRPPQRLGLPAPDLAKALEEDAKSATDPAKAGLRTGVYVDWHDPVEIVDGAPSAGGWMPMPDGGSWWGVELASPGAVGQRVHVSRLALPPGAALHTYAPEGAGGVFGPFQSAKGAEGLWLPTVAGDVAVVAVHLPPGVPPKAVTLEMARGAHLYRDPLDLAKAPAGACNLDSTCHPDWAQSALSVCGLGVLGQSGTLFCTGTLIANDPTCSEADYILTANHCVGGQFGSRGAEFLEFYWEYQTAACNGAAPSLLDVPRTFGGADYLAGMGGRGDTGGGNDFTFLRMRNAPPANIPKAGWTTTVPPITADVVGIHHPRGDFKRISFGDKTSNSNPHPQFYHQIVWDAGTTEPGSSGSPVFVAATQQIIGQLWGGGASCTNLTAPDYYGRFDVTYPIIAHYLEAGGATVGFESPSLAFAEGAGTINVPVILSIASAGGASVDYTIVPGTAQPGVDYTAPANGTLHFGVGETEALIGIALIDNTHTQPDRAFTILLGNAVCAAASPAAITVIIEDDDPDSDGDGISDYDEINGTFGYVTDPFNPDTDGDGISDYDEIFGTYGHFTDPTNRDTDGDGIPDFNEILLGLDPTNPNDAAALGSLKVPWFE